MSGGAAWFDLDPGRPVELQPLDGPASADLVVVGLGASGLAACALAAEEGADVVGLDAVGVAGGAAGANGGFLLAGLALFHHDAVARLGRARAVRAFHWTRDRLDEVFDAEPTARRVGSLRLAGDAVEEVDVDAQRRAMQADGLAVEAHTGPEGRGLVVPGDGVVHPVARCRRLAHRALLAGARLHAPAHVIAVRSGRAETASAVVHARHVLVAVDGGLEHVVPLAGVRTARLQMLATAPEPSTHLPRPEYRRWGHDYVQQLPTGEVLLGGGRDVGGAEEWDAPAVPTEAVQEHLDRELVRLGVTAPVTHRWAARAAFTDDRLPVCRTVDEGVHVVGAYSGHGNVIGPALAAEAVAAALDGRRVVLPF